MSTQVSHRRGGPGRPAPAFSLAEMMIALIILGFGLLVIGAALPVGFKYTKETVDRATGDAAVEYALDLIEQRIRLVDALYDDAGVLVRRGDVFRPRDATSTPPGGFLSNYEPLIKVRPLLPMSIDSEPGSPTYGEELPLNDASNPYFTVERRIARWLADTAGGALPRREYDAYDPSDPNWVVPALPSVSVVYPPIAADQPSVVQDFLPNMGGDPYRPRPVRGWASGAETRKALERGITWTAFYRRVSYASGSDPNLYEVIAVASRLPSVNHRFPRFDASVSVSPTAGRGDGGNPVGDSVVYGNDDTLSPVPWLVVFKAPLPLLPQAWYDSAFGRALLPGFVDPPTLRFVAGADTAALLPPGSIFIPAVNDRQPNHTVQQRAGFVPHAPDALPIYEVERTEERSDGDFDVIVKNNGFYPWLSLDVELQTVHWPVWVIPPAFKELVGTNPVFEKRSSIVAYARRFIRFREIP